MVHIVVHIVIFIYFESVFSEFVRRRWYIFYSRGGECVCVFKRASTLLIRSSLLLSQTPTHISFLLALTPTQSHARVSLCILLSHTYFQTPSRKIIGWKLWNWDTMLSQVLVCMFYRKHKTHQYSRKFMHVFTHTHVYIHICMYIRSWEHGVGV